MAENERGSMSEITPEMQVHFENRTARHISLVQKYGKKLGLNYSDHDASKLQEPELTSYIWITWNYRQQREGIPFEMPGEMLERSHEATYHHITHNEHHPEFWDDSMEDGKLNSKNRDGIPEVKVDATAMPVSALKEMCCDWAAMSEELGNSPVEWADKVVGIRYDFTPRQTMVIYKTLEKIWSEE